MPIKYLLLSFLFIASDTFLEICKKEGVRGKVYWIESNQMPGPGARETPEIGVERELFFHEVTKLDQVEGQDGFYSQINTPLILSVTTKANGTFKVKLPPGTYSVFVKEPKGFYANLFDKHNQINPVTVNPKQFTWLSIAIDYQAAY